MTHTARDGWKWVPVEPTEEMIAAARRNNHPRDVDTWNTMLSAAPSPPSEVTREEIARVLYKARGQFSAETTAYHFDIYAREPEGLGDLQMAVFRAYCDADAVLSLFHQRGEKAP